MSPSPTGFKGIWINAAKLFLPSLKRIWPWLLFTFAVEEGMDYFTAELIKLNDQFMLSGMLFTLAVILLLIVISMILVNQVADDARTGRRTSLWQSLRRHFKYVFIESTRALKPITLKLLLLVIPGLIESIRLYFIPYIVQFERQYAMGQVDALERSRALVRGRFWPVTLILLLTTIFSILPRFLLGQTGMSHTPVYYLLAALSITPELYAYLVTFCAYEWLVLLKGPEGDPERKNDGHSVSLQGSP